MLEKPNAIFVHGLNGTSASKTGASVRETLADKFNFIIPDFNILNIAETAKKIEDLVRAHNVQLLAGTSLGAFYVLNCKCHLPKIIINPCMKPSLVVPKIGREIPKSIIEEARLCEEKMYTKDATQGERVVGVFASHDELLGEMFKPLFAELYGAENIFNFEGGHHAGDKLHDALLAAAKKLEILN